MYDELELKSRPTQIHCRTHKQCQSGGPASLGEEMNRLKWFTLIKQQTAVSVKWGIFCNQNPCFWYLLLLMWSLHYSSSFITIHFQDIL